MFFYFSECKDTKKKKKTHELNRFLLFLHLEKVKFTFL